MADPRADADHGSGNLMAGDDRVCAEVATVKDIGIRVAQASRRHGENDLARPGDRFRNVDHIGVANRSEDQCAHVPGPSAGWKCGSNGRSSLCKQ